MKNEMQKKYWLAISEDKDIPNGFVTEPTHRGYKRQEFTFELNGDGELTNAKDIVFPPYKGRNGLHLVSACVMDSKGADVTDIHGTIEPLSLYNGDKFQILKGMLVVENKKELK